MATYFPDYNISFIHIPKTGSHSFDVWSKDFRQIKISEYAILDQLKQQIPNHGLVFALVRNPYSRFVGLYHHLLEKIAETCHEYPDHPCCGQWQDQLAFLNSLPFDSCIDLMLNRHEEFIAKINVIHMFDNTYGTEWTVTDNQAKWADNEKVNVIKLEEIDSRFRMLQILFKTKTSLPHTNSSVHADYRSYYSDRSKRIIEDVYARDFELFKYVSELSY